MCVDPVTASLIITAAASAAKAVGDFRAGQQEARSLERDATINDRQTAEEESRTRLRNEFLEADAVQEVSGSGLNAQGSVAGALEENRRRLELDALDVRYQGALTSTKLRANAKVAKQQAYVSLVGGLLGSAADVAKGSDKFFPNQGKPPPSMTLGTTKSQARVTGSRTVGPVY